jgi:hypothetical protein
MINVATVGVHDHKIHIPKVGVSSRILINKATPVARHSTSAEKMAALVVSVSFVNTAQPSSPPQKKLRGLPAEKQEVAGWGATPDLGGGLSLFT